MLNKWFLTLYDPKKMASLKKLFVAWKPCLSCFYSKIYQKCDCRLNQTNTSSIVQKFIALELYYINVNQQITDTKMHRNIKWVQNWDQYDIFRWLVNVGLLQKIIATLFNCQLFSLKKQSIICDSQKVHIKREFLCSLNFPFLYLNQLSPLNIKWLNFLTIFDGKL